MIFCNTVIIENEQKTTNLLRFYLKEYCPEIEISAVSKTVFDGIESIQDKKPDIVFLDIDLQDGIGFSLLDQIEHIDFEIIITTRNRDQAKKAFDYDASHYLLKPFSPIELRKAVRKAIQNKTVSNHMTNMVSGLNYQNELYITSKYNNQLLNIKINDIIFIESRNNGTNIISKSGRKIKSNETLKKYEEDLVNSNFYRVNRSYLINIDYVKTFTDINNCSQIEMVDGSIVHLPHSRKSELIRLMNHFVNEL